MAGRSFRSPPRAHRSKQQTKGKRSEQQHQTDSQLRDPTPCNLSTKMTASLPATIPCIQIQFAAVRIGRFLSVFQGQHHDQQQRRDVPTGLFFSACTSSDFQLIVRPSLVVILYPTVDFEESLDNSMFVHRIHSYVEMILRLYIRESQYMR